MKRFVIVGVGGRSKMFTDALAGPFKNSARLVGVCDINPGRVERALRLLKEDLPNLVGYGIAEFDKMLNEQKPDCVIVCTKDCFHDEYICRALEAGKDAVTEKPMTTDAAKCQRIVDTAQRTGKSVRVTFNYRYSPPRSQIKELLMSGVIGRVLSVDFHWLLDTNHGADYFRRWHRHKENSGGLMVHKATHHFDLVNWWLSSVPETVYANGDRVFYNEQQARNYGLEGHGERCLDCPVSDKCNFYLDLKESPDNQSLYLENEQHDQYYRDRCVFSDAIDIEDTMNVIVKYRNGARLSYSLNAFLPWEGHIVSLNGTRGRLEHVARETSYINGDGTVPGAIVSEGTSTKIFPHFQTPYSVAIRHGEGGHGGGDDVLMEDIFGTPQSDPLLRSADYVQGAYSILTGIAANHSMADGKVIQVADLVQNLPEPDFPAMPEIEEDIPFIDNAKYVFE